MLPSSKVRAFASWFYQLKCHLLQLEIDRDSKSLYRAVLRESIKRIDQYCATRDAHFQIILDELKNQDDFRTQIVSEASIQMFGEARTTMIEPPIQAESHLFQTLQCADWLCGLIGRVGCYQVMPEAYGDLDWTAKYFIHRLNRAAPTSGIRRERPAVGE